MQRKRLRGTCQVRLPIGKDDETESNKYVQTELVDDADATDDDISIAISIFVCIYYTPYLSPPSLCLSLSLSIFIYREKERDYDPTWYFKYWPLISFIY